MDAPKRIFLELNNTPPCNFGALWFDAEVHEPAGENCAAYVLESEVNEMIQRLQAELVRFTKQDQTPQPAKPRDYGVKEWTDE